MKIRPLIILILFITSTAVIVWLYFAADSITFHKKGEQWASVVTDLNACMHRKELKSRQYDHFAGVAQRERRPHTAALFMAMAHSERIHQERLAVIIENLGGGASEVVDVALFNATTPINLKHSIKYARNTLQSHSNREIERAFANKNRYAAQALVWAAASDAAHIHLMDMHLGEDCAIIIPTTYCVCPECGDITLEEYSHNICPICLTDSYEFVLFD